MKCPICGKELELKNKQVGTNENGDPIFNEYAVCRDCRKQWNLDKQRAKKAAAKKAEAPAETADKSAAPVKQAETPVKKPAKDPAKKADVQAEAPAKDPEAQAKSPEKKPAAAKPKRRPQEGAAKAASPEEKRYSNIPPEKVRTKRETAVRKGYEDMLATGTIGKPVKKKKAQEEGNTRTITKAPASLSADKKSAPAKASVKKPEPEIDEYDDDDYYDTPRFRAMRVIMAILSIAGFGYLTYRGVTTGLSFTAEAGEVAGMTFLILGLCLLVSALLYLITLGTNSVFAFLLPMLFYLGSAVFAFLKRGDDLQVLIAAGACAVLAVISLILAITSRGGDDYDDDYDDAFEDDYADE